MNQSVHKKPRLDLIKCLFMFVCLLAKSQTWALILSLFNKRTESKQKILFMNMLVNNKAKKETNQAEVGLCTL